MELPVLDRMTVPEHQRSGTALAIELDRQSRGAEVGDAPAGVTGLDELDVV